MRTTSYAAALPDRNWILEGYIRRDFTKSHISSSPSAQFCEREEPAADILGARVSVPTCVQLGDTAPRISASAFNCQQVTTRSGEHPGSVPSKPYVTWHSVPGSVVPDRQLYCATSNRCQRGIGRRSRFLLGCDEALQRTREQMPSRRRGSWCRKVLSTSMICVQASSGAPFLWFR
jgi:hypothetical protein